jgi:hypothetical protein
MVSMSPTFGEHFTSELPRTPLGRSSQHSTSRHSGEALSTVPHPQKPRHIGQTVNARGFSYSTCCTLQPLVARQCRGRDIGIESTADVLLTKPSIRTSCASHFYGICRYKREPTSGLEPLTLSHYECAVQSPQVRLDTHAFLCFRKYYSAGAIFCERGTKP